MSVCILISSCNVYGGPLLSAYPLTHFGDIFVFLVDVGSFLAAIMMSASGLDWSKTPSFSLFQIPFSADSLSKTCYIVDAFQLYIDCIIPYNVSTAIVPRTSVLYEVVSSMCPSVGPYRSMIVVLSMHAIIHTW
jgi:hypothetical protein